MGWLGRLMEQETHCSCCFCGESDDMDNLEAHRYCRYYSYTKRYYHGSCLRQVLNNPEQHSANDVDTALAIAEQRKRHEEALHAEEEIRRKRLADLGYLKTEQ